MTPQTNLSPAQRATLSGVILAGGRGQRMQGADKGLLKWHGTPLIEHAIRRLQPQVAELYISVNRNLDQYARWHQPLLTDRIHHFVGPLAGIHAALLAIQTPWLVTAPCDAPCLPTALAARLYSRATQDGALAVSVHTDEGAQPVFALYHYSLAQSLSEFLAQGKRKLQNWQQTIHCVNIHFADTQAFINLNTPQSLNQ